MAEETTRADIYELKGPVQSERCPDGQLPALDDVLVRVPRAGQPQCHYALATDLQHEHMQ